jgi:hypothetical protein
VTEREAPPDWGFENWQDDPYEEDGWFGREQVSEPTPVVDRPHTQPVARTPPPPTRRLPSPTVNTWTVNGQLRASSDTALTFRSPPQPWYRTKKATIALIAAASAAVAVPIVIVVWPSSPATAPSKSTSVAPQASTSAQPAPSSAQPIPTNAPPPPPPPPPPPTEDPASAPADSQPYWTRPASPPSEKPDVGVTRTPVTRAPISVAPQPRQQPTENNSAKPGDGRKGFHCGGWC